MIAFFYETDFKLKDSRVWKNWIKESVQKEGFSIGELNYIFCDDEYLLEINRDYLNHDYYTDVIGFQYSQGSDLTGDIYISVDRITENAKENQTEFKNELARVMIHGVLHFMGYGDKTELEKQKMTELEDFYLKFVLI
ncbi:MAG: rRNA maturation RNase YbeY [Moheibacter sp.]